MFKRLFTFIIAAALLTASSCGGNKATPDNAEKEPASEAQDTSGIADDVPASETETETEAETIIIEGEDVSELFLRGLDSAGFSYSTGAGAWYTDLTIYADGTFEGKFHDWDGLGPIENEDVIYECNYTGHFSEIRKLSDYTYSLTVGELTLDKPQGTMYSENGTTHVTEMPAGIKSGDTFTLYQPGMRYWLLDYDDQRYLSSYFSFTDVSIDKNECFDCFILYNGDACFFGPDALSVKHPITPGSYPVIEISDYFYRFEDLIHVLQLHPTGDLPHFQIEDIKTPRLIQFNYSSADFAA